MNYELRIKNKIVFLFSCFLVLMVVVPVLVSAWSIGDPLVPCGRCLEVDDYFGGCANYDKCDLCDLAVLADNIVSFLLFVLIMPAGVIALIISGILMLTAGGDPGKIEKGKAIFSHVVIGMFIAFGAWLIVDLIIGNAILVDQTYIPVWDQFPTCTLFQ